MTASAQITQEKRELADSPDAELNELTALSEAKGLSEATALTVAAELTVRDALVAHLEAELHIDPADIPSPVQAAASALSFTSGALLPMLAILLPPAALRVPVTFAAERTVRLVHGTLHDVIIDGDGGEGEQQVARIRKQRGHGTDDGSGDFDPQQCRADPLGIRMRVIERREGTRVGFLCHRSQQDRQFARTPRGQ